MMEEYGRAKDRSLPANRNLPLELWELGEYPFTERVSGFLIDGIWDRFLKLPKDDYPRGFEELMAKVKEDFYSYPWNEVYDLIEFIAQNHPSFEDENGQDEIEEHLPRIVLDVDEIELPIESYEMPSPTRFIEEINQVLQEEQSGYCFIGDTITPIRSHIDRKEVEAALDSPDPVAAHLQRALELLSERERPDYRNSIKEAISAVESIANLIADDKGKSLGDELPTLKRKLQLHGALTEALSKLYGWTSNVGGVRHAMVGDSQVFQEDALFSLTVCSAYVNYLKVKAAKAGIPLD